MKSKGSSEDRPDDEPSNNAYGRRPTLHIIDFTEACDIRSRTDVERFELLCYFKVKDKDIEQFSLRRVSGLYKEAGLDLPDKAALEKELKNCSSFRFHGIEGTLRFTPAAFEALDKRYGHLWNSVAGVPTNSEVIDEARFCGKREGLDRLAIQINSSYRNGSHDACASVMRRLFEVSMILAFQSNGIEDTIRSGDGYLDLDDMVKIIIETDALGLSGRKDDLLAISKMGDYSGLGPMYTFSINDINSVRIVYRELLEILYNLSGLS